MVRISDGFQPHLVSPELGLRKLVHESIEMVLDPVSTAVRRVHQVLLECARWVWTGIGSHECVDKCHVMEEAYSTWRERGVELDGKGRCRVHGWITGGSPPWHGF